MHFHQKFICISISPDRVWFWCCTLVLETLIYTDTCQFPCNIIVFCIVSYFYPPLAQRASAVGTLKKMARVMFDYEATQVNELTIKVDDMAKVITNEKDLAEPGW